MARTRLSEQEQYQQRVFDSKAAEYDNKFLTFGGRDNRNMAIKVRRLSNLLAPKDGDRILEVGCGSGIQAKWLLEHHPGIHLTATDLSGGLVKETGKRLAAFGDRCTMRQENANDLSFEDNTFDSLYCSGTLHHMEQPGLTVKEFARVLKPGGRLVLMEPNWTYPTNLMFMVLLKEDRNMWLMRRGKFLRWMEQAGLVDLEVDNLLYTPPKPEAIIPLYDAIDSALGAIPVIRRWSLMLSGTGVKA